MPKMSELQSKYYGVFSQKQLDNCNKGNINNIYYEHDSGKIVHVTEVFSDPDKKSMFDDAVYLGPLKKFHSVLQTEMG